MVAVGAIELVLKNHPTENIIFANGGDRTKDNIPEQTKFISHKNIEFAYADGRERWHKEYKINRDEKGQYTGEVIKR